MLKYSALRVLIERAFGFCAPSVRLAWRQTLEIEGIGRTSGRGLPRRPCRPAAAAPTR